MGMMKPPTQWVETSHHITGTVIFDVWEVVALSTQLRDDSAESLGTCVHLRGGGEVLIPDVPPPTVHTLIEKQRERVRAWEARQREVMVPRPKTRKVKRKRAR
jgi:hypothetical protein